MQGDQKFCMDLMITIQKVTSNVQSVPASLQTFIDTSNCIIEDRVQYSTVHINVCTLYICTVIIRCTETFDHPVYMHRFSLCSFPSKQL
jgi:hypothetical protein